jgi:hypothetical protein
MQKWGGEQTFISKHMGRSAESALCTYNNQMPPTNIVVQAQFLVFPDRSPTTAYLYQAQPRPRMLKIMVITA